MGTALKKLGLLGLIAIAVGGIPRAAMGQWTHVPGELKQVSVGADGTVFGVQASGSIWRWLGGGEWENVPGTLSQISVGSAEHIWGVDQHGGIYRWTGSGWENIRGTLKQVSVAADGSVFGLQASGSVWRLNGDGGWDNVPGTLSHISVGSANVVWGVQANGTVWRSTGPGQWANVPGTLRQVEVGADGTVMGLQASGSIWRWQGLARGWQNVPGTLAYLSVKAANLVWGGQSTSSVWRSAGSSDWGPFVKQAARKVRFATAHGTVIWVDRSGVFATAKDRGLYSLFTIQPDADGWFRLLTAHDTLVWTDERGTFRTAPATDRGAFSRYRLERAAGGKLRLVTHHKTILWVDPQGKLHTSAYGDRGGSSVLTVEDELGAGAAPAAARPKLSDDQLIAQALNAGKDPKLLAVVSEAKKDPQGFFLRAFLAQPAVKGPLDAALGRIEAARAKIDGAVAKLAGLAKDGNLLGQWKERTVQVDVPTYSSVCIQHAYSCGSWGKVNCRCPGGAKVCLPWKVTCDDVCNRWDRGDCILAEPRVSWSKKDQTVRYFDPSEGNVWKEAKEGAERLWAEEKSRFDALKSKFEADAKARLAEIDKGFKDGLAEMRRQGDAFFKKLTAGSEALFEKIFDVAWQLAIPLVEPLIRRFGQANGAISSERGSLLAAASRRDPASRCNVEVNPVRAFRSAAAGSVAAMIATLKGVFQTTMKNLRGAGALGAAQRKALSRHLRRDIFGGKGIPFKLTRAQLAWKGANYGRGAGGAVKFLWVKPSWKLLGGAAAAAGVEATTMALAYPYADFVCAHNLGKSFTQAETDAYTACFIPNFVEFSKYSFFDFIMAAALVPLDLGVILPLATSIGGAVAAGVGALTGGAGAVIAGGVIAFATKVAVTYGLMQLAQLAFPDYERNTWPVHEAFFKGQAKNGANQLLWWKTGQDYPLKVARIDPCNAARPKPWRPHEQETPRRLRLQAHNGRLQVEPNGQVSIKQVSAGQTRTAAQTYDPSILTLQPESDGWFRLFAGQRPIVVKVLAGADGAADYDNLFLDTRSEEGQTDCDLFRFEKAPGGRVRLVTRSQRILWVDAARSIKFAGYDDRGGFSELTRVPEK